MTKKLSKLALVIGLFLVIGSMVLLVVTRVTIPKNREKANDIANELFNLMPEVKNGFPDDRVNVTMSCIELDGVDYNGVVEIPNFDVCLPVANNWSATHIDRHPHRFSGSVYDGSLIIGGSDNEGQFDFMKIISVGDFVFFTDTLGIRYSYFVDDIEITDDVSYNSLSVGEWDLVLFARNSYGFDYTVVKCKHK